MNKNRMRNQPWNSGSYFIDSTQTTWKFLKSTQHVPGGKLFLDLQLKSIAIELKLYLSITEIRIATLGLAQKFDGKV